MPDRKLKGDAQAAVDFLRRWYCDQPRHVVSIKPDGPLVAKTFLPGEDDDLRQWIGQHNGTHNLYFHVNDLKAGIKDKRPSKSDIDRVVAFHADLDFKQETEVERQAAKAEALDRLKAFSPRPTVIVDSGGGYHAYWRLNEPIELNDDQLSAVEIERYNIELADLLDGDNVQDVSRIMRIPETINVLDDKKRERGRKPALASVVEADWVRVYTIGQFQQSARKKPKSLGSNIDLNNVTPVSISGLDLSRLPKSERDQVTVLIATGLSTPEMKDHFNGDRSRAVWHVICALIRADVSDQKILGTVLNHANPISEHVYDQMAPETYAAAQLKKALKDQPRPGPLLTPNPLDQARAFRDLQRPALVHYHQEFLAHKGAAYARVEDDTVRSELYRFMETCQVRSPNGPKSLVPTKNNVSSVIDALQAEAHLAPSEVQPPCWLDGREEPNPAEVIVCRNGILHLPSGELFPQTPEYFTRNALDFDFNPDTPKPEKFLCFLDELWPEEQEHDCITALQEFWGYTLSLDTSLQKALMICGPKRSGKGTLGRIHTQLVGSANTTSPSLNSLGKSEFALEPLIGKQLAVVSDMRLSPKVDEAAIAENILRITGEDQISVNRKYRPVVDLTLSVRFVIMTNILPKFSDRSGALASRFIVLPMHQSFFGREDPALTDKLVAELPGILNWAIEGWRRVHKKRFITQPQGGLEAVDQMADMATPIPAFVDECCELGMEFQVEKIHLFMAFKSWHDSATGVEYRRDMAIFATELYSAMPAVRPTKSRDGKNRVRVFSGIALKADAPVRCCEDDRPM